MNRIRYIIAMFLCVVLTMAAHAQESHWQCDGYAYEYDMAIYFTLEENNVAVTCLDNYEVAAFVGDECRGVGSIVTSDIEQGQTVTFGYLRVHSNNASGETVTFKVYDSVSQKEYDVEDYTLSFHSQTVVGLPSVPVLFSILDDCNISVTSSDVTKGTVEGATTVKYGVEVTITATANEGYHFVNWTVDDVSVSTDAIYTFAANGDVSLVANFAPNQYTMTFVLDNGEGNVVKTQDYDTELTAPADPTRTGFTFKGWSPEVPATIPASDMTFTAQWERNSYTMKFVVDGETVKEEDIPYEGVVTKPDDPQKEGYTFTGWQPAVPETMPANDVTCTAQFAVNQYIVTFTADGKTLSSEKLDYGTLIVAPAVPEKEGHTFTGWNPELTEGATVPAHDVTYDAVFDVNSYFVIYMVNGEEWARDAVKYGAIIVLREYPVAEGYVFSGWQSDDEDETMPAHDVVYTAELVTGISAIPANIHFVDVYHVSGALLYHDVPVQQIKKQLPKGLYVVRGKKFVVE